MTTQEMRIAGIDISAFMESVAASLARQGSDQQAKFLNIFFNEMFKACGSTHATGSQCLWIKGELNDTAKEFAAYLHDSEKQA